MITKETANAVWDILVNRAGALENERIDFVLYATEREDVPEYRFRGLLGFGGKVYLRGNGWKVYYYSEDCNDERQMIMERTNRALAWI